MPPEMYSLISVLLKVGKNAELKPNPLAPWVNHNSAYDFCELTQNLNHHRRNQSSRICKTNAILLLISIWKKVKLRKTENKG